MEIRYTGHQWMYHVANCATCIQFHIVWGILRDEEPSQIPESANEAWLEHLKWALKDD